MKHRLAVQADVGSLAEAAAAHVEARAAECVARSGRFTFAVSGGSTPWRMFAALGSEMPWEATTIYQVDERLAPIEDPDRNLAHLTEALADATGTGASPEVVAMPVEDPDPESAAAGYGEVLPTTFDLVHLGLGPDGHTASLVPGDPVLKVTGRPVAVTGSTYQGRRRMTLTYEGLARAAQVLWLVSGSSKADALALLMGGDRTIPAGRVEVPESLVMADAAAASEVGQAS